MNEEQLQFVRTLYGKYGMNLDPDREAKVLDAFSRDFDGSLSVFYSKYNPEKEVTPDFIGQVRSMSGFAPVEQMQAPLDQTGRGDFADFRFSEDASFTQMVGRTADNFMPSLESAYLDAAGWLAGGEAKMSQSLGRISEKEGIVGSVAGALQSFVDWRPFADSDVRSNEDWHRKLVERKSQLQDKIQENVTWQDVVQRKDLSSLAAFAVEGAAGFLPSLAVGVSTFGAGFVPMFAGAAYMDALKEKSEVTDEDMLEIVNSGNADWFIPTMVGSVAGMLEKWGLKGVGKYLSSALTKKGAQKFLSSSAENVTRQSFINWTEHGLHEFAKEYGRSEDIEKATEHMADAMFSDEGVNAFTSAGLGTFLMGGVTAGAGALSRTSFNKDKAVEEAKTAKEKEYTEKVDEMIFEAEREAPVVDENLKNELDAVVEQYKKETLAKKAEEEAKKEVEETEKKLEKESTKESKAEKKVADEKFKDVAREVKDANSLQKAIYEFFNIDNTDKGNVEKVSTVATVIDRIVQQRANREGIKKADWYRSRIASIGRIGETEGREGAMTNFLEDGRAVISALEAPNERIFFREFGKVLQKDLTETEAAALETEFGINFREVNEESETVFLEALETYLETGEMPSNVKGPRLDLVRQAFDKISQWLKDIKAAIQGQPMYINDNVRKIFDAILTGTEIEQNVETGTEALTTTDVQSDTAATATGEQADVSDTTTEGEVVDMTETQETVLEAPAEQETKQEVEDEQTTKKEDGEKSSKTPQAAKKDGKDTEPAKAKPKRDRTPTEQETVESNDGLIESGDKIEAKKFQDGRLQAGSKKGMNSFIKKAKEAVKSKFTTPEQKKSLNKKIEEFERILHEDKVYTDAIKKVAENNKKKRDELKDSGMTVAQINEFTKAHPNKEMLSFEPSTNEVIFSDTNGEIGSYTFEDKKLHEGKDYQKRAKKMAEAKAEEELKREEIAKEEARAEAEKKRTEEERKNADKAEKTFDHLDGKKRVDSNSIARNLDRLLGIDFSIIPNDGISVGKDRFAVMAKDFLKRYLQSRTERGKASLMLMNSYEKIAPKLVQLLEREGLFDAQDKTDIRTWMRQANDAVQGREEAAERTATKKEEAAARKEAETGINNTLADPLAPQVTGISVQKTFLRAVNTIVSGLGIKTKYTVIDVAAFDPTSPSNKGKSADDVAEVKKSIIERVADVIHVKDYDGMTLEEAREAGHAKRVESYLESAEKALTGKDGLLKNHGAIITLKDRKTKEYTGHIIVFNSNAAPAEAINTLMHEVGHSVELEIINKAPDNVKKEIEKDYNKWLESKKGIAAKAISGIASIFDLHSLRSPLSAKSVITSDLEKLARRKADKESGLLALSIEEQTKYAIGFSEYIADQVAYWATTSEKPVTFVGKLFKDIADAVKKIMSVMGVAYDINVPLQDYLNDQLRVRNENLRADLAARRVAVKNMAADSIEKIDANKRKIADLQEQAETLKKEKTYSKEISAKDAAKDKLERAKKAKEIEEKQIPSLIDSNKKLERKVRDYYNYFTDIGGQSDFKTFKQEVSKKAEANRQKKIERDINSAIYDELEKGAQDSPFGFDDIQFMSAQSKAGDNSTMIERIAAVIEGKFNTRDEFKEIIKHLNKTLVANGIPKLKTDEINQVFDSTKSGAIARLRFPLLARYTGIGRKKGMARPTDRLKSIIDSMNASLEDRAEAQNAIYTILESHLGRSVGIDKINEASKLIKEVYNSTLSMATGAQARGMRRAMSDDLKMIAQLELVGIANAPLAEIKRVHEGGYVKEVLTGEASKVRLAAQKAANATSVQADSAVLADLFGLKPDSKGNYFGDILRKGKKIKFSVFDMNKAYKKGDTVLHLGKVFEFTENTLAGEAFNGKMAEFKGHVNRHYSKAGMDRKTFVVRAVQWMNDMFLSSHGIESLVARLSKDSDASFMEGEMSKAIGEEGFRLAGKRSRDLYFDVENDVINIVKRVFGVEKEKDARKKLFDARTKTKPVKFTDNDGNSVTQEFYISELMDYYAAMRQPDLQKRFESMAKRNIDSRDARFWNASKQAAILDAIPQEYKSMVEAISEEVMPKMYNEVNKTHRKINGYDLISLKNYFPVTSRVKGAKATELDLEAADVANFLSSVSNNNLKDRSRGGAIQAEDYVMKLFSYVSKGAHYTHYAQPVSLASKLFEQQDYYRGLFSNLFGNKIMEQISWNLNNIAANGAANFQRNAYIDLLRNTSIAGAFMANLTMIPKQISSFAAYARSMPVGEWAGYYATLAMNPKKVINDIREINEMNFIKERIKQSGRMTLDTLNLQLDSMEAEINKTDMQRNAENVVAKINHWLFKPTQWGDLGAIYAGGAPYLSHLKRQAKYRFPNDTAKQKEWVEVKFEESTARTQQSRAMLDASKWQTQGSVQSLFVTFMSTPMLYGRILSGGIRDINRGYEKYKKGNRRVGMEIMADGVKNVALFGLVLPYLFHSASNGSFYPGGDDDDRENNPLFITASYFAISMFQHVPILYPLLQNFMDNTILERNFDPATAPPIAIASSAAVSMQRIVSRIQEDGDMDWSDEAVQKDIDKVAKALGLNTGGVRNLVTAWADPSSTVAEDWRLLLGYSPYALGMKKPGESAIKIK